ncbi:MAG: AAA family ATPase [Phycisphaerales bacterium]
MSIAPRDPHPRRSADRPLEPPDGVTLEAWLRVARSAGSAWEIDERDAEGNIVGIATRGPDGRKGAQPGSSRGLIIPNGHLPDGAGEMEDDPLFVAEGASDCAALLSVGLDAVGVPMAGACADQLAELVHGRHVALVRDSDGAGHRGAGKLARALVGRAASVRVIDPPLDAKDARDSVLAHAQRRDFEDAIAAAEFITSADAMGDAEDQEGPDNHSKFDSLRIEGKLGGMNLGGAPNPVSRPPRIISIADLPPAEEPDWLWPGFIARGGITLLSALPKAGKSTLMASLIRDLVRGGPLVGEPARGPTLILSEEPAPIWALRRTSQGVPDNLLLVHRDGFARPTSAEWLDIIGVMADAVGERGVDLCVIDTLGGCWPCDDENDSSATLAALSPLRALSEAGAGVLVLHHARKAQGSNGTAHRGSNAIAGFPDILADMRFYDELNDSDRRRILVAKGRFPGVPQESVVEYRDGGYAMIGSVAEARGGDIERLVMDKLPSDGSGVTPDELRESWPTKPAPSKTNIAGMLNKALDEPGCPWERFGMGVKGDPYRFRLKSKNDNPSDRSAGSPEGLPI